MHLRSAREQKGATCLLPVLLLVRTLKCDAYKPQFHSYTKLFLSAGMRDTVFEPRDPSHRDSAIGYAKKFDSAGKAHFEGDSGPRRGLAGPHGGAYSTTADLS